MLRSFPLAPGMLVAATLAVASAQTLSVLSGDGQITVQNYQTEFPLVVLATNASGQPASGVTVNWSLNGPGTIPGPAQTVTDSNGQASNRFVGATIYGDNAFTQSTITATAGSSSVTMHVTTSGTDLTSGEVFIQSQINLPMLGQAISGPSGGGANAQVQVYVFGVHNAGVQLVPNVSILLIPENPNGPSLACAPGTGLTGANGIANCQVIFSGPAGTGIYDIQVGGYRTFSGFSFTVTQGSGAPQGVPQTETIAIIGGNNQSGLPGSQLPLPLTARVQNSSGNPLPNVQVVWAPGASVSLSNIVSTSDANGLVSAIARLGSAAGPQQVQLRTADGAAQTVFNLTATSSPTTTTTTPGQGQPASIRITGGSNQSGAPGARLPAPLTAQVLDSAGNPLPNVAVVWQSGASVSLSNVVSTTDSNGMVSALATLGYTPGAAQVQVQAGSGGIQTPFGATAGGVVQAVFTLTTAGQALSTPGQGQPSAIRLSAGNNQSGSPGTRLTTPLRAQIVDASGNPLPNITATWQPGPSVFLSNVTTTSDANGFVTATATLGSTPGATQVQVQAGTPGIATPFGVTNGSFAVAIFNLAVTQAQSSALRIVNGANQSGPPGARLLLTAQVVDGFGNPIPNVTAIWQPAPLVSLGNVVSISDGNGIVSAVATLGSTPGLASVQVQSGGSVAVFNLTVVQTQPVQGPPAIVQITGGNNQSGAPGSQLSAPLTARITDAAGNPLPNIAVAWSPQSAALTNVVSTSDANGMVSAIAILGSGVGPAQVQLRIANGSAQATFMLQASLTLNGLTILTGSNQTTTAGAAFPESVTVQLFTVEGPAGGLPVQFTSTGVPVVISGSGAVSTDSTGRATISIQAGSQTGVAIVTASSGSFSSSVYLVVQAPQPVIPPLTFYNAASNQPGPISPTEILSVYGAGLAPGLAGCVTPNAVLGPLPLSLSGMQVQFASDGYSAFAPLYSVCNFGAGQQYAVVEVPADLPMANITVTVQTAGSPVGSSPVPAAAASIGIFETAMSDGAQRAVLQRPDGSYVSLENPAQPGEQLSAFVTGLGRPVTNSGIAIGTNQAGIDGDDAPPPVPVTLQIGGETVPLISAVYSKSTIGVYVLTFDVPADASSGTDISLTITAPSGGSTISANPSKIPVQ